MDAVNVTDVEVDTTTAGQILKPVASVSAQCLGLATDLAATLVIGRAPFADMLDMTMTARADLVLIEPADIDAR